MTQRQKMAQMSAIVEKLKELLDSGVITQEEFVAKKKQILNPTNNDKAD